MSRSTVKHERVPPIFFVDHPAIMEMLLVANADHLHVPDPGYIFSFSIEVSISYGS